MHWRCLRTRGHSEITDVGGNRDQVVGAGKRSGRAGVGNSPVKFTGFLTSVPPHKGDFIILKPVLEKQNLLLTKHIQSLDVSISR